MTLIIQNRISTGADLGFFSCTVKDTGEMPNKCRPLWLCD